MSDEGAFTPAKIAFTLSPQASAEVSGEPVKRRPGRPPGAKNKATLEANARAREGGSTSFDPGARKRLRDSVEGNENQGVDKDLAKKAEKAARADEYAKYIMEDVNDKIFMAVVLMTKGGIKADQFYLPGKAPASKVADERLSPLGQAVAIPPDMANAWGKLLAELSFTEGGKTATKYAGSSGLATLGAALTALVTSIGYVTSVKATMEGINQMILLQQEREANGTE